MDNSDDYYVGRPVTPVKVVEGGTCADDDDGDHHDDDDDDCGGGCGGEDRDDSGDTQSRHCGNFQNKDDDIHGDHDEEVHDDDCDEILVGGDRTMTIEETDGQARGGMHVCCSRSSFFLFHSMNGYPFYCHQSRVYDVQIPFALWPFSVEDVLRQV